MLRGFYLAGGRGGGKGHEIPPCPTLRRALVLKSNAKCPTRPTHKKPQSPVRAKQSVLSATACSRSLYFRISQADAVALALVFMQRQCFQCLVLSTSPYPAQFDTLCAFIRRGGRVNRRQ